jgi:hypothetical protein
MMDSCMHHHLLLLPHPTKRVRCRECHLTLTVDELSHGYCPECFEVSGKKRSAFEEVPAATTGTTHYRCEDCGVHIACE